MQTLKGNVLQSYEVPGIIVARYTDIPVVMNGILDDPAWKKADVYLLSLSKDQEMLNKKLQEGGEVMVCWDKKNLYVGVKFYDSDIVTEVTGDQEMAFAKGDTLEVFLKPKKNTCYWELYATPNGKKTTFWFPSRGRRLESCYRDYVDGLQVAAQVKGTLNDMTDKDEYWTAEMKIPLKDLTSHGDVFGPGAEWSILVARYNYGINLSDAELTSCPQLPVTNFHLYESYATLKIEK
jgi:hypothetical protein